MIRNLLLAMTLTVLASAGTAQTRNADPDVPPPDPRHWWRIMHADPARTTSECLGQTPTPLCVVDNYWACHVRRDGDLCRVAWNRPGDRSLDKGPPPRNPGYTKYRIFNADRLTEKTVVSAHDQYDSDARPGDIRMIIEEIHCDNWKRGEACQTSPPNRFGMVVRKSDDNWFIVKIISFERR